MPPECSSLLYEASEAKVNYFKGINFRRYKRSRIREFFGVRESLYPRNRLFSGTRESLYPRNITFVGAIEISIKNHQKWRENKRISP